MPIAAPADAIFGIRIRFRIQSVTAPAISEYRTILSFPSGTRICMPKTLVMPMSSRVGMMICMGITAPSYAVPDKK